MSQSMVTQRVLTGKISAVLSQVQDKVAARSLAHNNTFNLQMFAVYPV